MRERIQQGDEVKIIYPSGKRNFWGKVLHIPVATGDSWIIQDLESKRSIYYISEPITILWPNSKSE